MTAKREMPDNVVSSLFEGTGVPNLKDTAPATGRPEQTTPAEITQAPQQIPPAPRQRATDGRKNNRPPKKPKRYTVPVTLRISEEQKLGIDRQADREQTDAADIIRRAINEYLQNHR